MLPPFLPFLDVQSIYNLFPAFFCPKTFPYWYFNTFGLGTRLSRKQQHPAQTVMPNTILIIPSLLHHSCHQTMPKCSDIYVYWNCFHDCWNKTPPWLWTGSKLRMYNSTVTCKAHEGKASLFPQLFIKSSEDWIFRVSASLVLRKQVRPPSAQAAWQLIRSGDAEPNTNKM